MVEVQSFQGAPADLFERRYTDFSDVHSDFFVVMQASAYGGDSGSRMYPTLNARLMELPAPGVLPTPYAPGFTIDFGALGVNQIKHDATDTGVGSIEGGLDSEDTGYYGVMDFGGVTPTITDDIGGPVKLTWPHVANVGEMNDWQVEVYGPVQLYMGFEPSPDAPADQVFVNHMGLTGGFSMQLSCYPDWPAGGPVPLPVAERHGACGFLKRAAVLKAAADIVAADMVFGLILHESVGQLVVDGLVVQTFSLSDSPRYELYMEGVVADGIDMSDAAAISTVTVDISTGYVYTAPDVVFEEFSGSVQVTLSDCVLGAWSAFDSGSMSFARFTVYPYWYSDGNNVSYPALSTGFYQGVSNAFWTDLQRAVEVA